MTNHKQDVSGQNPPTEASWTAKVELPEPTLRRAIKKVGPREETAAGVRYFSKLLKQRGPKGLLDTLARFRKMLDEGDGLDLAEMKKHERDTYQSLPHPYFNRRHFLGSTAWGLVGISALGGSALSAADDGYQALTPKKPANDKEKPQGENHGDEGHHGEDTRNYAKTAHELYEQHVVPYENLIVGAALVNEGIEKWQEIRLRQIKDTVLRMGRLPAGTLEKCTKPELAQHINQLTMGGNHKDWVAQQFLGQLLQSNGEQGVLAFVKRARTAIDEQNELDLEIDLDPKKYPHERKLFDAVRCDPRRLSPSDFLETWGWILPGFICVAEGGVKMHHNHIKGEDAQNESPLIKALETYVSEPGLMMLGSSLINEFNLNWKEIKLEQIADAVIEMNHKHIDWKKIQPLELEEIIDNLDEPQEKFAGIYFLRTLLKSKGGVGAIENFMARANTLLDATSAQDLPDCFTARERQIFKSFRCRPNLMDSENFLHTLGWGIPGAICLMTGASSAADLAIKTCTGSKATFAGHTKHWIHTHLGHLEGIIIGAALINEALEKYEEYQLGQISDATAQLVNMTSKQGVAYK